MKITAVVISNDHAYHTSRVVDALLSNDWDDLEIVIWDSASSQSTIDYLLEWYALDSRISLVLAAAEFGYSIPLRSVWNWSDADFVAYVDVNVRVPADFLRRVVTMLQCSESIGILAGLEFSSTLEIDQKKCDRTRSGDVELLVPDVVSMAACVLRRDLFVTYGWRGRADCRQPDVADSQLWIDFQNRLENAGYVSGYTAPVIVVDRMDPYMRNEPENLDVLNVSALQTNCECELPGFCLRHGLFKGDESFQNCRRYQRYFDLQEDLARSRHRMDNSHILRLECESDIVAMRDLLREERGC